MKPVLNQVLQIHYVDSSDMIKFIDANSKMKWNDICDFVRENDICNGEYGPSFWEKNDLIENSHEYNEEQVYWVGAFFEAHPWIERMMIVFSD
jgi:TPP-dependent 2-oxoacid decarboxylase